MVTRAAWRAGVLGAINVFALILSLRLILLISICGAIGLTWVNSGTEPLRLAAVAGYCLLVVVPMVWLSARK